MSLIYDLVEAKVMLSHLTTTPEQKTFLSNFFEKVGRLISDCENQEIDLDEQSSSSSVISLGLSAISSCSSCGKCEKKVDDVAETLKIVQREVRLIQDGVDCNGEDIKSNWDELAEVKDMVADIIRRQRGQHNHLVQVLRRLNEETGAEIEATAATIFTQLQSTSDLLESKITSFDRANDYFIKEIERLAGHPNI